MKKIVHTDNAPKAVGPYSQAVMMGDFMFCSGQISIDPKTNEVYIDDITKQTEMVIKNIQAVLAAENMTLNNIVKSTIFLTSMSDFAAVNDVYGKAFTEAPPARSTIAVAGLPKGVKVEIEVIAHR